MSASSGRWMWDGANPIAAVAVNLEFESPFTPAGVSEATQAHSRFRADFPRRRAQQVMQISLAAQNQSFPPAMPQPMPGVIFDKVMSNGLAAHSISVSGNVIMFHALEYKKWAKTRRLLVATLSALLPSLQKNNRLVNCSMQYNDQFLYAGDAKTADCSRLLKPNPYVAPNAIAVAGLWHCHHGWFAPTEADFMGASMLENVNINVNDIDTTAEVHQTIADIEELSGFTVVRGVEISLFHRMIFTTDTEGASAAGDNSHVIGRALDLMHRRNKSGLRALLVDEVINRIPGLEES